MAPLDSSELEKRISELERSVGEIQTALFTHKLAIDSLMRGSESVSINLRELEEELRGRTGQLEGKPKALGMRDKT